MGKRMVGLAASCLSLLALVAFLFLAVSQDMAAQEARLVPPAGRFRTQGEELPQPGVSRDAPDAEYNITLWHGWGGAYAQEYYAVVAEFNTTHPTVTVELVYQPGLGTALSGTVPIGQGPDVVAWANDPVAEWGLAGYLAPLDPWIDKSYLASTFEPAAVQGAIWNERIWGIPESQEALALVYNRALISEPMLPDPADFGELLAKAAQFQFSNPGLYYVCNQGLGNPDAYHVAPIYFGHGLKQYGGYLDGDGQVFMTTTVAISAAQWIADFRPYATGSTNHDICMNMLIQGNAGAWWTGPWALADLESAGLDYGIAPMGSPFAGIKSLMMTPNAVDRGNAVAAISFMKYFGSMEVQKRLALANKTIPANKAALNDPEVQALYAVAAFGKSLDLGTPLANHRYHTCQWGPVGDATTAIWTGAMTPEDAMNAAQAAILDCVAELRGQYRLYLPLLTSNYVAGP